jgi:hypothetical protein
MDISLYLRLIQMFYFPIIDKLVLDIQVSKKFVFIFFVIYFAKIFRFNPTLKFIIKIIFYCCEKNYFDEFLWLPNNH